MPSSHVKRLKMMFVCACGFALLTAMAVVFIAVDSYTCNFSWTIPGTNSNVYCQDGMYRSQTIIKEAEETYKINTKSFYIKLLNRIVLIPYENDIDVEQEGSLAVYDAEKIKTPQRTFGLQPISSMTLLHDDNDKLLGVAIFSDPNSIFVPAKDISGEF
mgnify:CR=1 FL=1